MASTVLEQIPIELRQLYKRHWNTIKKSFKRGVIKDVHHYPLLEGSNEEILAKLTEALANYTGNVKINVAFGFALRKRGTGELRFFHPSNNTMLFDTPRIIANTNDQRKLENDMEQDDGFEYARLQRPSTSWTVEPLMCVRFDIFKL